MLEHGKAPSQVGGSAVTPAESGGGVAETIRRLPIPPGPPGVHHAFSENQIVSKTWLADKVHETLGGHFGTVYVLGGWYGLLGAIFLNDPKFRFGRVLSFDIDPGCAPVAERLNAEYVASDRFKAITADACALDYQCLDDSSGSGAVMNLVINTSCEHMPSAEAWYGRLPTGILQAFQSNDYFDCDEHVNCIKDLAAFKRQVPMTELLYEGALQRKHYSRFMLIGRK
ncbi:MAG: class I SAM-dependent methyltransferase [Alphaproteobacteria bacterium]